MSRATPTTKDDIPETTDDSVRVVTRGGNTTHPKYHLTYHGKPACGIEPNCGEPVEWSVDQARAWRDPCSYCFPDGDSR